MIGPIYSIQRYVGVQECLKSNFELTARESIRTQIDGPRFTVVGGGVREFYANETPLVSIGVPLHRSAKFVEVIAANINAIRD